MSAFALALAMQAAALPALRGRVVPPYPSGWESRSGVCVPEGEDVCARAVATLDRDGHAQAVLAEAKAGMAGAEARWRITDLAAVPAPQAGQTLALGTCERDWRADPGIVALVDGNGRASETHWPPVRWALRLDRASGRFVALDPGEVRCLNEGYGL